MKTFEAVAGMTIGVRNEKLVLFGLNGQVQDIPVHIEEYPQLGEIPGAVWLEFDEYGQPIRAISLDQT